MFSILTRTAVVNLFYFILCFAELLRKLYTAPEKDKIDFVITHSVPKDPDNPEEVCFNWLIVFSTLSQCYSMVG